MSITTLPTTLDDSMAARHSRSSLAGYDPATLFAATITVVGEGALGQNVRNLQAALNGAGITPPLTTDGDFGPATEAAVKQYQRQHGLVSDGIAGSATLGKLGL